MVRFVNTKTGAYFDVKKNSIMSERMTSFASGCEERMNDSVQQVHSRPWIHTTGIRGLFSNAQAIFGAIPAPSPNDVAARLQYLRKLRRVTP